MRKFWHGYSLGVLFLVREFGCKSKCCSWCGIGNEFLFRVSDFIFRILVDGMIYTRGNSLRCMYLSSCIRCSVFRTESPKKKYLEVVLKSTAGKLILLSERSLRNWIYCGKGIGGYGISERFVVVQCLVWTLSLWRGRGA